MSRSPIENQAELRIGVVEFIAPDEIKVQLDLEAPDGIAANAGVPREFPRINSYVLIPNEGGHIVCQVEWIAIERSSFPKRKGFQDYGLIDLPFPIRKMRVAPLGLLKLRKDKFKFERGVHSFPSIGSPVLIPTDLQLLSIVESGSNRRVYIGNSPLTANAEVKIDPDRLFGRHLAVLGNTGSGKSCTVAGLIQWSLEATEQGDNANARFIILDPNGEYSKVFGEKAKVLKVGAEGDESLEVPLWLWNSSEWQAFTQAKPGAQLPLLKRALRAMRNELDDSHSDSRIFAKRYFGTIITSLRQANSKGTPWSGNFGVLSGFYNLVKSWEQSTALLKDQFSEIIEISNFHAALSIFINKPERTKNFANLLSNVPEIDGLLRDLESAHIALGGNEQELLPKNEDLPIPFDGDVFINYLAALAQESGNEQYLEFLIARVRTLLGDSRMDAIIGNQTERLLDKWLEKYFGNSVKSSVTIIDLSLVPTEIVHVSTSVISRLIFEALQRYRKLYSQVLPTVLVMEEAHSFITRYNEATEGNASSICTKVFERIAREGRKFGLGLVLSSQRPSELSPTVLSQCNSFILHRISNDRDQELVSRLLPDNFRGLLRELPSLPSQKAILLGWASELPILMKVRSLPFENRPHSEDPDYWNVWTRENEKGEEVKREVEWKKIANDWQEINDFDSNDEVEDDDFPF